MERPKSGEPSLLGGIFLVPVLIALIYIGWYVAEFVAIFIGYGSDAYFYDGLRIANAHTWMLSNGASMTPRLSAVWLGTYMLVVGVPFILYAEFIGVDVRHMLTRWQSYSEK